MLTYRLIKGSPLTIEELDENFQTLNSRIDELDEKITPVSLSIEQDQDVLILKNCGENIGHIIMPRFEPCIKGKWQPSTLYKNSDWSFHNRKLYSCITDHQSTEDFEEQKWNLIFDGEY